MRSLSRLLVLLLWVLAASSAAAAPGVSVLALRPTQMQIGKRAAQFHVDQWRREAKAAKLSLRQYAETVLKPAFAKTELPMIINPSGAYRNTDGHHRVTALRKLTKLTGVRFEVAPKILADYRGQSFEEYAHDFIHDLKKGQFTPEIEALPAVERMKHLPNSYAELGDSPMRTALEIVFTKYQIKGSWMRDYIEFRAGNRLIKHGLLDELRDEHVIGPRTKALPDRLAMDPRVLEAITKQLGTKDMRKYLLSEANGQHDRKALEDRLDEL